MIIFNGKKYAENGREFTDSLFQAGGTCNGFAKRMKNGYRIFNIQNELIAFIRCSKEPMVMQATMRADKKIWYSYLMDCTEKYLGLDLLSFYDSHNAAREFSYKYWTNENAA